jgi:hypothetical protein
MTRPTRTHETSAPSGGIPPGLLYPEAIRTAEAACVAARQTPDAPPGPAAPTVGFALSGGGIRSATFCLGVFRALARLHLVGKIDVLSTVSGGGYFGAFLGGLFTRRDDETPGAEPRSKPDVAYVENRLCDLQSPPVRWLRENGRYMSPNGSGDILLAGAVVLRNWVALLLVLCTFVFTILAGAALVGAYGAGFARGFVPTEVKPYLESWNTYLVVTALLWMGVVVPAGWAFWFTQRGQGPPWMVALALPVLAAAWRPTSAAPAAVLRLLALEAALALLWWGGAALWIRLTLPRASTDSPRSPRALRNRLSRMLSIGLWSSAVTVAFALIDWAGAWVHAWATRSGLGAGSSVLGIGTLTSLLAVLQRVVPKLIPQDRDRRISLTPQLLSGIAAAALVAVLLVALSALVHAFACPVAAPPSCRRLLLLFAAGFSLTMAGAFSTSFLNLSSHHALYGARLTRAYLGASNANRHRGASPITELVEGDEVPLAQYAPHENGGPLHLVNVTLNETVSGRSQIEQRDRKGLTMAVGPAGISVGTRHHARWERRPGSALTPVGDPGGFAIFPRVKSSYSADSLDLGGWVALSGAAFTPGLGARTSLSLSLLLGLANVRLGYWWNSGIKPRLRGLDKVTFGPWVERVLNVLLPVQTHLLNEVLGRFHGPARMRWYLSDGGHSENTGAYELIRRRLPFIVISDAGRDQKYQFEDLANLVRRVRTDFDAEVAFLTREQTDALVGATSDIRRYFGAWADFEEKDGGFRGAHALLAYVYYDDPQREGAPGSLILVLKPTLDGDEPLDVRNYAQSKCDFPQESTVDQYFDEAQWESYRRLGEHIASRVFAPKKRVEGADSQGRGSAHEDAPPSSHWRPFSFEAPATVTPFVW